MLWQFVEEFVAVLRATRAVYSWVHVSDLYCMCLKKIKRSKSDYFQVRVIVSCVPIMPLLHVGLERLVNPVFCRQCSLLRLCIERVRRVGGYLVFI